ncbi:hypothetical protein TPHA_0K01720 [Tetrapisispora phaffii CBS 4417]|uniref:Mannosyl-oligosaccharide glucosidase n=1 Tax=Tetrapisispora phaffii (strain ATCC 24235 / CBS 4417 / NBRC 1672 / NRRL Y-8282 / UCD 70-5) TaxID=1071381 RepID=G8BZH7_TETPH|nr:hypothetical protein TPHA_0K01720 [Tetrapisispora phaffii CBS 4417]CCE65305.1 hypothetical protein TPHA_0K01720 [Tetrapisispora phaffii CBS 4417]
MKLIANIIFQVQLIAIFFSSFVYAKENKDEELYQIYTNSSLLWAPYRSNCYFGLRPRYINDSPLIMGIMWFDSSNQNGLAQMRHFVNLEDKLKRYSWEVYDPRYGGKENIIDEANNLNITYSFVKTNDGQNWSVRVNGQALNPKKKTSGSIVVYLSQNGEDKTSNIIKIDGPDPNNLHFVGLSKELGDYHISVTDNYGKYFKAVKRTPFETAPDADSSQTSHLAMVVPDKQIWKARDIFQTLITESINQITSSTSTDIHPSLIPSIFTLRNIFNFNGGNFHYIQKSFDMKKDFEFDIIYNHEKSLEKINSENDVTQLIQSAINKINIKFNKKFKFDYKFEDKKSFALETLSNLLGGIGYFHGTQYVDRITELNEDTFEKVDLKNFAEEAPLELFSTVPSRGFFPRGFYWDEGFNLLQVMEYDFGLAFELLSSWINIIEEETGWVPREVILGDEARSKVPDEFIVQTPRIANPPTLFVTLSEMLIKAYEIHESSKSNSNFGVAGEENNLLEENYEILAARIKSLYPKLVKHYDWFRSSQKVLTDDYEEIFDDEGILDNIHLDELYRWSGRTRKHCLPSGLDDYPRAQPPDLSELNVDTLAWVGIMTKSLKKIASILELKDEAKYEKIERNIIENLDTVHWSEENNCYCDVSIDEFDEGRVHVCHKGYISLLPFALKLIPENSDKLEKIVSLMEDKEELYSEFGLRSLSKQDQYYRTEEDYWRGKIWMPMNYINLDALRHYFPDRITENKKNSKDSINKLYHNLKNNLINNIFKVWKKQGFVYENYDPETGAGSGAEQFTGWTALIVNIMGHF